MPLFSRRKRCQKRPLLRVNKQYEGLMNKTVLFLLCFIANLATTVYAKNPEDPYESVNRKIYAFNDALDRAILKPIAKVYQAIIPAPARTATTHFFDNLNLLPTVANDLLQGSITHAMTDTWRFIINSTLGLAGTLDPATSFGIEKHMNDLGITLARWGDHNSPYIVIPLLGPSTVRDGVGMVFDYTIFSIYPYIEPTSVLYGVLALNAVDTRANFLETDKLIEEALDPYAFVRDAYLQHRHYVITGIENGSQQLYEESVADETPPS